MATQYDVQAGFDPSGQVQISGAQLLQMVNQIAPLSNIGGVIVMSGAASAHPDVTNNPRFIRYLWIDNEVPTVPVLKMYKGVYPSDLVTDWTSLTIADGSVTAAKLDDYAVTVLNDVGQPKIVYNYDASANAGKVDNLLCLDANGQYVIARTFLSLLGANIIPLPNISTVGAINGHVLTYQAADGLPVWAANNPAASIGAGTLGVDRLQDGTNSYLIRANNTTGDAEYVINSDKDAAGGLFPNNSIPVGRLYDASAADKDTIRFNGTNWVKVTPFYVDAGATVPSPATGAIISEVHGLNPEVPRTIKCFLICNTIDIGYQVGDVVDAQGLILLTNAGEQIIGCTVGADDTDVFAVFGDRNGAGGEYRLLDKTTFRRAAITPGSWDVYFYAEL